MYAKSRSAKAGPHKSRVSSFPRLPLTLFIACCIARLITIRCLQYASYCCVFRVISRNYKRYGFFAYGLFYQIDDVFLHLTARFLSSALLVIVESTGLSSLPRPLCANPNHLKRTSASSFTRSTTACA